MTETQNKKCKTETCPITRRATNVGIKGMEIYIPTQCVSQEQMEEYDGVSKGKYTIGLGQTKMGFVNDTEDIYSMSLTVLSQLIQKYNIDTDNIGRLDVGTETLIDKSKSVKSVLTQLLPNNKDTEGIDSINACYGGTNALFNALNWMESPFWDGRDALVVCGDIAVYDKGAARPTGGAGTVAMWIGCDAPIVFDHIRGNFMDHVYDFYKPDFTSEYPVVDGHFSLSCYVQALDQSYKSYSKKAIKNGLISKPVGTEAVGVAQTFDYSCFHVPTCKLVAKSYGRLFYNDFRYNQSIFPNLDSKLAQEDYEKSLFDKTIEKTFVGASKEYFQKRVQPSLVGPTNIGNMYTGSLFSSLASLLTYVDQESLANKRIGMFSYGSGLASTLFSCKVVGDLTEIVKNLDLDFKLNGNRTICTPKEYEMAIETRENLHHHPKNYKPTGSNAHLKKGTYYLQEIDDKFKRVYAIKE